MISAEFSCDQQMIETNAAYSAAQANKPFQRRPRSESLIVLPIPLAAPLNASVSRTHMRLLKG
jgi:hypothetical protein